MIDKGCTSFFVLLFISHINKKTMESDCESTAGIVENEQIPEIEQQQQGYGQEIKVESEDTMMKPPLDASMNGQSSETPQPPPAYHPGYQPPPSNQPGYYQPPPTNQPGYYQPPQTNQPGYYQPPPQQYMINGQSYDYSNVGNPGQNYAGPGQPQMIYVTTPDTLGHHSHHHHHDDHAKGLVIFAWIWAVVAFCTGGLCCSIPACIFASSKQYKQSIIVSTIGIIVGVTALIVFFTVGFY